jgi:hypothetical protein
MNGMFSIISNNSINVYVTSTFGVNHFDMVKGHVVRSLRGFN